MILFSYADILQHIDSLLTEISYSTSFQFIEQYWVTLSSFPLVIKTAFSIIFLSLIATIISITTIFGIRGKKERDSRLAMKLRPKMFAFFKNILVSKDIYTDIEICNMFLETFGKLNNKAYESIIPSLEDVVNDEKEQLKSIRYKNIIKGLKIDIFLEKKLDYADTRTRLNAFHSLSRLELTISDSKMLLHTYSKNDSLRKESRASYVGVSNNDPFKFFNQVNDLNHWDQINLMQQLELHHKDNLPNFSKWIVYSEDPTQTVFFIRMVSHFKQSNSVSALIEVLDNPNHNIRVEAILAIGKMQLKHLEPRLMDMYYHQPLSCQNAIIEALAYINSGEALDFLTKAYDDINDFDAKRLIAEVIYLYNEEGREYFDLLLKKERGFNYLTLEHVINPLIPSVLRNYVNARNSRGKTSPETIELLPDTTRINLA
ncbi:HEAT repeat domain-containing protein [Flavobacterium cerinum]|uniref:HEAT repeat domain-containing protein n=1 Tax=Flavobacterium cerinum TaxID=2502784 RepID=A0A3S3QLC7_9FLAO|nr:HEAT repeat domain-containing protein [Flavobacterium cerinum]RWW91766.1 HEAT repeat domain-containing protein [Flavobacterium cerinum]